MAQKQMAPTTTIIRTPIRTEIIMSFPLASPLTGQHPQAGPLRQGHVAPDLLQASGATIQVSGQLLLDRLG
jgi:hypothetical protein